MPPRRLHHQWDKTSLGFTVSGDWAFEPHTYKVTDTDEKTNVATTDEGKAINIFPQGRRRHVALRDRRLALQRSARARLLSR